MSTATGARRPAGRALLAALRPRQWTKNVLVLAAPLASGRATDPDVLAATAVAFGAFCLAASATYLVNDLRDLEEDRAHPVKRSRPLAAGELAPGLAVAAAAVLLVGAVALASVAGAGLVGVLGAYVLLTMAYSFGLKDQAVLDLAVVASGFLLRAMAGGVAAGIAISPWFLLAAAFGSLFMVAGKRFSEGALLGEGNGATRRTLSTYSLGYLRFVWGMSATVTVMTYALWAVEVAPGLPRPVLAQASIAPFVLGILRYAVDVDRGTAGEPEDIVMRDRVLQLLGLAWLVLFAAGVFDG